MNEKLIIERAEQYLCEKGIAFVRPGNIVRVTNDNVEVVFLVPEALDKNVAVVDPPDVRVNINVNTKEIFLTPQM